MYLLSTHGRYLDLFAKHMRKWPDVLSYLTTPCRFDEVKFRFCVFCRLFLSCNPFWTSCYDEAGIWYLMWYWIIKRDLHKKNQLHWHQYASFPKIIVNHLIQKKKPKKNTVISNMLDFTTQYTPRSTNIPPTVSLWVCGLSSLGMKLRLTQCEGVIDTKDKSGVWLPGNLTD